MSKISAVAWCQNPEDSFECFVCVFITGVFQYIKVWGKCFNLNTDLHKLSLKINFEVNLKYLCYFFKCYYINVFGEETCTATDFINV